MQEGFVTFCSKYGGWKNPRLQPKRKPKRNVSQTEAKKIRLDYKSYHHSKGIPFPEDKELMSTECQMTLPDLVVHVAEQELKQTMSPESHITAHEVSLTVSALRLLLKKSGLINNVFVSEESGDKALNRRISEIAKTLATRGFLSCKGAENRYATQQWFDYIRENRSKYFYSFHKNGTQRIQKTNHYILLTNVSIKKCIRPCLSISYQLIIFIIKLPTIPALLDNKISLMDPQPCSQ